MLRAVPHFLAPRRYRRIVSSLAFAAVLASSFMGAAAAHAAQSPADSIYYADVWTPSNEKASLHIDGGLFSPIEANAPSPTFGLRLSKLVGSHLQVGVLTGWTFERKDLTEPVSDGLPGSKREILLARVDESLIPLMGYVRVNLTEKHWLVPYLGVGSGVEWLSINATDYRTDQTVPTTTYVNWAWQGWVGMGIRLGSMLRLSNEVFYNGGSLERDVIDQSGQTWTEVVSVNGVGARVGIDIIFQ